VAIQTWARTGGFVRIASLSLAMTDRCRVAQKIGDAIRY